MKSQRKMFCVLISICLLLTTLFTVDVHADGTPDLEAANTATYPSVSDNGTNENPSVISISSICKNDAVVTARLRNASALEGKWSRLAAQIYDGAEIKYTLNNCSHGDIDTGECTISFEINNGIQLPYGKYTMNILLYDENDLNPEILNSDSENDFYVTSKADVVHDAAGLNELNSTNYIAIADSSDCNWEVGEQVDIAINSMNESIHSVVGSDNKIRFSIPTEAAISVNTWEKVEIYRSSDRALIAVGEFAPEINAIICNDYYTRYISMIGYFLKKCDNESTYAELYDGNTKLETVHKYTFLDNLLLFHFKYNLELGKEYAIKLYSNGKQITNIPDNGKFSVVPLLNSDKLIIPGTSTGDSITVYEAPDSGYQWEANDNVYLAVGRPDTNYAASINRGIVVSDSSIEFSTAQIAGIDGHPLQKGQYSFAARNAETNASLGFCTISVGAENDYLTGTLYSSDGQPSRGAILIEKENAGWVDEITVPDNGRFCCPVEKLRGAGTYVIKGIPSYGSADAISVNRLEWNGTDSISDLIIRLNRTQITGEVTEAAAGSEVTVFDENWNYILNMPLNNGRFNIGGLEAGRKYNLVAGADWSSNYINSIPQSVELTAEAINNPIVLNFALRLPQITGSVFSTDGTTPLEENTYQVDVRALDGQSMNNTDVKTKKGRFIYGGLEPGRYYVTIRPNSGSSCSQSSSHEFLIAEDGTAAPDNFVLQLTYPRITGKVVNNTGKAFKGIWVDIFKGYGSQSRYITGIGTEQDGTFKIGGLPEGKYYIRAGAEEEAAPNTYSTMKEIDLSSVTDGIVLELNERALRILHINPYTTGDNTLSVRLQNVDLIHGDLSGLSVELIDAGGNLLTTISGSNLSLDQNSLFNEDQDLCIKIPEDLVLTPGNYKLKLTYQGNELENNWQNGDSFNSVYGLDLKPWEILPLEASERTINIKTSKGPDNTLPDAWSGTDALTVKIFDMSDGGHTLNNMTINADNSITATLPSSDQMPGGKYSEGWYRLEVYRADEVIARRYLNIAVPDIRNIWNINDESDSIGIEGDGLSVYIDGGAVADIYDSSSELVQSTSEVINNGGTMQYFLRGKLIPGQYTLKLKYKGNYVELPNGGRFNVVPMLGSTPLYIDKAYTQRTVTFEVKDRSMGTPWAASDPITVKLSGSGGAANIDSSELTVSENGISFTLPTGLSGDLWAEIFRDSELIANSKIYIYDNAQLKADIKDTQGNAIPYARIIVDKKDYSNSYVFDADKNGNTVVNRLEPGEYYIRAAANKIGNYIDSQADQLLIKDDGTVEINGAGIPDTVSYTLAEANIISGTLRLPDGRVAPSGGVHAWVFVEKNDGAKGYGTEVFIPEGAGSAQYALPVSKEYKNFILQYWVDGNGNNYVNHGYYSVNGTVFTVNEAANFPGIGEDMADMNIVLVAGSRISGTVTLPSGFVYSEDINIYIGAVKAGNTNDRNDDITAGTQVNIPANESSAQYSLVVPKEAGYVVSYTANGSYNFEDNGFYSSNGTVNDPELATAIDVADEDKTDINLYIKGRGYTITVTPYGADPGNNPESASSSIDKEVWQVFGENGRYIIELKDAYGNTVTKEATISDFNKAPEP